MAITSVGYEGSIDEAQWAESHRRAGADYFVDGPGDWKVTVVPAADRTLQIAPGRGGGMGVQDVSDEPVTVGPADVVNSGTRWDLVVARRNWSPEGDGPGETTFEIVEGTSTKAIPATRNHNPGVLDDQPLALVRFDANQQTAVDIVDLRCWAGNGGVVASSVEALEYLGDRIGSVVMIGDATWVRSVTPQGAPAWVRQVPNPHDHDSLYYPRTSREFGARPNAYISTDGKIGRTAWREEEQTGEVVIAFSARSSYTRNVSFAPGRFSARPVVEVNISTGAAASAQWHARAISVTKDGFTLFLFTGYPSGPNDNSALRSAWNNFVVQWHAVRKP